jgi:alkylhydroperoxidase family enzyme
MPHDERVPLLSVDRAIEAGNALGVNEGLARLSIFQVLLQHPKLAKPFSELLFCLLFKGSLPVRLRELVIMRTGWVTGCAYEWTQHWSIAKLLGVDEEALLAVREWEKAPQGLFDPAERAALAAVDDVASTGEIGEETWALVSAALAEPSDQVELVMLVVTYAAISSFLRSLEIPLEDGVEPWPPDGRPGPGRAVG